MKRRQAVTRPGYGKLLDAWMPPAEAGVPVGCVATSFTFSTEFFEEECLSRFLQLESDPQTDGPTYLIEREEKLAQVGCAAALVDSQHCRGSRSLRWDLLTTRVPGGVMHAKIVLLQWSERIRLIISSANLTEDGYRRNQEIFGVLDYYKGSAIPIAALHDVINFLREATQHVGSDSANVPASRRWLEFLEGVRKTSRGWGSNSTTPSRHKGQIIAVLSGPGHKSVLDQLKENWLGSGPPLRAYVTSPFFDPPDSKTAPERAIWSVLNQRGAAQVAYNVTATESPDDGVLCLQAPESLLTAQPSNRSQVSTAFYLLDDPTDSLNQKATSRFQHSKSIWLENGQWAAYLIGSSNFTSKGLGLSHSRNLEANLLYGFSRQRDPQGYRSLEQAYLYGDLIDRNSVQWAPQVETEESQGDEAIPLPAAFDYASYGIELDQQHLKLEFAPRHKLPAKWTILAERDDTVILNAAEWKRRGSQSGVTLPWAGDRPPSNLRVTWSGCKGYAWWPVNVTEATALPPPEELRDLPLDVLIDILTSARPLHQALRRWLNRKQVNAALATPPDLDPHKRVDTSKFLLQRTRRMSHALSGLRERLERPVPTVASLEWRLYGPVGVAAVANALRKEAKNDREYAFLMAEMALELSRVQPAKGPGCLSSKQVSLEIQRAIGHLRQNISNEALAQWPDLRRYVQKSFREATQ